MTTAPAENFVDRDEILPLLGTVKRSGEWLMAFCPVHSDGAKHGGKSGESLGLSDTGVLKCFAGCDFGAIMEQLRGGQRISSKPTPIRRAEYKLTKLYQYRDTDGEVVAEKGRFESLEGKSFKWRKPGVDGWPSPSGIVLAELPLYGAERISSDPISPVYFVEGEKACEACWEQGLMAVTHGGGAGTKDFGKSLEVLKDRDVYLWADNDAPGRAFMTVLQARLQEIAASIHFVEVSLPDKGDAYDWFAMGNTLEGLRAVNPNEPAVTILATDAVQITVPTLQGPVTMTFSEMEKTTRDLDAEVEIRCAGGRERPYCQHLNLLSSSGRTELRRDLDNVYGKEYGWTKVLNTALALARDAFLRQDRGVDVWDIPDPEGEVMLVAPLVVADGPTIFFGDGSSGKSYLTFLLALVMSAGEPFCGIRTPKLPVMVIDYEDSASNFRRRLRRLSYGLRDGREPFGVTYWSANGIPLKDQAEAIKRKCDKDGIGLLIIDSAAPACGGPPEESAATLALFRALKKIGLPSIIIAHVNKSGDTNKPFGSTFWHNEARRTWFISRVQEEDSDEIDVGFYCRKVNDGRKPHPLMFHLSFEGVNGPVRVTEGDINDVPELMAQTSDRNQVWAVLENTCLTSAQIAEQTGLSKKSVDRILTAKGAPFEVVGLADASSKGGPRPQLWGRKTPLEGS